MPNMKTIIASRKKQILSNVATTTNQNHDPSCNCRKKAEFPLDGKCLQANDGNNNRTVRGTGIKPGFKEDQRTIPKPQHILPKRQQTHNATELSEQYMDPKGRKQNISN